MKKTGIAILFLLLIAAGAAMLRMTPGTAATHAAAPIKVFSAEQGKYVMSDQVVKSKEEWKKILSPEQYHVLREQGTEIAFTGKYWNNHAKGIYRCAACGLPLFSSDTKFESGTGWPSFWAPIAENHVRKATDESFGMERDEVQCARCGGHLGHVFDDGPAPTGLRYCLDSVSLQFVPAK